MSHAAGRSADVIPRLSPALVMQRELCWQQIRGGPYTR